MSIASFGWVISVSLSDKQQLPEKFLCDYISDKILLTSFLIFIYECPVFENVWASNERTKKS